jgi:hypothetical protein
MEKLRWADHHLAELEASAWEWLADKGHLPPFAEKVDVPQQRKIVLRFTDTPPVPPDWPLRAADAIANYRSVLDYIAWQLVDLGSHPKPLTDRLAQGVQFPIIYKWKPSEHPADLFAQSCTSRLPGVDPTHIKVIERHQPYKWGSANIENHPLVRLTRFSNRDKHRQLRLVGTVPSGVTYDIVEGVNCSITHVERLSPGNFQPNADFLWIYYDPTGMGEPDVLVRVETRTVVAFADGPALEITMREIAREVREILDEFKRLI